MSLKGALVVTGPRRPGDKARQLLLLSPGMAFATAATISLLRKQSVVGWTIFVLGLVFLLAFAGAILRSRQKAPKDS
jgi:hypothetical protein